MRRLICLACATLLLGAVGCDEKDKASNEAAQPPVRAADAPPAEKPQTIGRDAGPAATQRDPAALTDAVGAAPSDPGRVLFDGEKPVKPFTTADLPVAAPKGRTPSEKAASVVNAPPRKDTLTIHEPPAPESGSLGTAGRTSTPRRNSSSGFPGSPAVAAASNRTQAAPTGSAKPRIVYLGDSLSTRWFGLGPTLYPELVKRAPGYAVEMYAYGGSSPAWFLPRVRRIGMGNVYTPGVANPAPTAPKIDELLKPGDVKMVIVEQGTNMINWTALKRGRPGGVAGLGDAAELAKTIGAAGAACLWIGPPDMDGYAGSNKAQVVQAIQGADAALAKAVAPACTYIKSSDKTSYAGGDGIHQSKAKGEAWAAILLADPLFKLP